nr:MAG TPA: hypothetical protein [Caudoviricetes sp.]
MLTLGWMDIRLPWAPETRVYDISEFFLPCCDYETPEIVELWSDHWRIEAEDNDRKLYYDDMPVDWDDVGETLFFSREEAERRVRELKSGEDEGGNDLEKV